MKKMMLAVLAAGAALTVASTAQAAGGCGPGFHRGPYGGCRPNFGPGPGPAIGVFYPGQGYWYGGRYWGHRYAWRGGWRYR
jgi:hypothetical protein